MTSMHTIPLHIGDFSTDTMHLSPAELGAYLRLLIYHYKVGIKGIPNNDKTFRNITGCTPKQWSRMKETVLELFDQRGEFVSQKRTCSVLSKATAVSSQNKANALKRWNSDDANALPPQSERNAIQYPVSNIQEDKEKTCKKETSKIGTRWEEQIMPPAFWEFAHNLGTMTEDEIENQYASFTDFWIAKAGKDGGKLNWLATWRNWIRNYTNRRSNHGKSGGNHSQRKSAHDNFAAGALGFIAE